MADKLIGQNIAPPDLEAKVTGRARFAEDFRAEGMVFAKLLSSPFPHARVRRIDASRALRMPGVLGVITADDLPDPAPPSERPLTNEPLYVGEPILALAAVDETTAADAIEQVEVDLEPLPFVIDPLGSLRPDGPNARLEGNTFVDGELTTVKWTEADFAAAGDDELPMGEHTADWSVGDLDAGFAEADLILEETIVHQSLTHHPMEPRSCMAYWQNGKLHLFGSTQSTARTHAALANMLDLTPDDIVLVSQFCGGGFGSKIAGSPIMAVPALLSRQLGRPVMLRITRYEENYIGRARPAQQARVRMGWRADGKVTAIDLFMVQDHGPYGSAGDHQTASAVASLMYQPHAMRFRGISIYTNTPPRSAQRQPGAAQISSMLEPLMDKAARELKLDRVEMRRVNAPDQDSTFGPGQSGLTTAYVREAIDIGADKFGWSEKTRLSGRREGTKLTGVGVGLSAFVGGSFGYDGLILIRPDGDLYIHQGTGNLGTHSFADTARAAADVLGMPWDRCHVIWGDTAEHLPWSSYQAGSQTAHAHSRANHAAGHDAKRKLQKIAARDLGGLPDGYETADGRIFRRADPAEGMSFSEAASRAIELGGEYSGQELPEDIHAMTAASAQGLAGQGLMGVAKDNYARGNGPWSFVIGFALVEVDAETGEVEIKDYTGVTDCGTVLHPRGVAGQMHGGAVQGFGMARSQKWVIDPRRGEPFAYRLYTARPPSILDAPLTMDWDAVDEPDPQNPVGAKGVGEPPLGAAAAAITSAVADALGGTCLCRTPLTTDVILAELEGREQPYGKLEMHV